MKGLMVLVFVCLLTSCASNSMPLIFGQTQTLGISIGAGTTEQGAEFALGYHDRNIALVPVENRNGESVGAEAGTHSDAYSVLGQFEVNSENTGTNVKLGLGKFFATGLAAKTLADGFSCQLSGDECAKAYESSAKIAEAESKARIAESKSKE